jgi:RimJ/RimL family protein N-acetyltransferase
LPIYRGLNYSQEILIAVEQQERALKQTTLTAAAFSDNIPSIRALTTAGFKSTVVRLTKEI